MFRLRPNLPFEGKVRIPKMTMDAKYASTGVLLVLPANGNGTFHADLGLYNSIFPVFQCYFLEWLSYENS